jgi:L-ascorbate metabolism protein UlaG (beta-lactamase superfamily)
MTIRYLFHSGFSIECDDCTVVIDYFLDDCQGTREIEKGVVTEEYLKRPGPFYVLSSHGHGDHFNPVVLEWQKIRPDIRYILSRDILLSGKVKPSSNVSPIQKGERYEDRRIIVDAYGSTDLGVSFVIRLDGKILFHAGDLNFWHWNREADAAFVKKAEHAFLAELDLIRKAAPKMDVAMFPIDPRLGPDCGIGAEQFTKAIAVFTLIPMHFATDNTEPLRYKQSHPNQRVEVLFVRGCTFSL